MERTVEKEEHRVYSDNQPYRYTFRPCWRRIKHQGRHKACALKSLGAKFNCRVKQWTRSMLPSNHQVLNMAAHIVVDCPVSDTRTVFTGTSEEDSAYLKIFWKSIHLNPTIESRLVSSDVRQRISSLPIKSHGKLKWIHYKHWNSCDLYTCAPSLFFT